MADVTGAAAGIPGSPVRSDLAWHDLMGGNTFLADVLPDLFPGEVDPVELDAARARAEAMLGKAAGLDVIPTPDGIRVRVTNETGHKLPSGYPEGRRMWIQVEARDGNGGLVLASGAYDPSNGVLTQDDQVKIYEIKPGLSPELASALGLTAGPSFHFVLNDSVYLDNRIPPRGFTNAGFEQIQSPPVGYTYPDGVHWDETDYTLPPTTATVTVRLLYQTTSKKYVDFLRDENVSNDAGQRLHDAWAASGRCPPTVMADTTLVLEILAVGDASPPARFGLAPPHPNPVRSSTALRFTLERAGRVRLGVYDAAGRLVRRVIDADLAAGPHETRWDGHDERGRPTAGGVYFVKLRGHGRQAVARVIRLP
jgi:hypothetical protein